MEAAVGNRVMAQVEETSLEEVLKSFRSILDSAPTDDKTSKPGLPKLTHLDELDHIAARHYRATQSSTLSLSGRNLPLLYKLVSTLVSSPHNMAVLIIDLDARFDATCLTCADSDVKHVYIHRPERITSGLEEVGHGRNSTERLRSLVCEAQDCMLYGAAARPSASGTREFWGTVVAGGLGAGIVTAGWKGWLRVDHEHVREFALGTSAEEALDQRSRRQEAVEAAGWAATSQWGNFTFQEEG